MDFMQTILGKVISVMRCEYAQQKENNEISSGGIANARVGRNDGLRSS